MGSVFNEDVHVRGRLTAEEFACPDGAIDNQAVAGGSPGDYIEASKVEHRRVVSHRAATPVTETVLAAIVYGTTGSTLAARAVCGTAPTGDYTITVDVKADGTSLLTSPIAISETQDDSEIVAGTLNSQALAIGDLITVEITVAGTSGTVGADLLVELVFDEDPV